jgi:two-component system cell cycle sensor histidine kinase/response regulator CckA
LVTPSLVSAALDCCAVRHDSISFADFPGISPVSPALSTQTKLGKPLTETEQRLRTIVTKAPVVFFALDLNGVFTLSEGSALQKLGLQPGEVVGRSVFEMYSDHPRILMNVRRALRGDEFSTVDDVPERHLTFETHWAPLRDAEGNLTGTIAVAVDVSDRNRNAREREQAQVLYRSLVEQLAAVTYIAELGLEGSWVFVSPQIESLLGYSPHEWLHRSANWIEHVHPDDRTIVAQAENATLLGEPFRAEYRMFRRDGNVVWINDSGTLVRGEDGSSLIHGVLVDVTEQKQLQGRLAQSARMEAVGQLASGVAHDFNNLLTIIKGYSSLLLENGSAKGNAHAAREIQEAADRAAALTRQLLAFGRKQTLQPRILDLNTVVHGLEKMLRRVVTENVELTIDTASKLGSVNADPVHMEQVILNLVVNARDAMPSGGKLIISTGHLISPNDIGADESLLRAGSYITLSVSDTGIGMDATTRARVFEPFFTTKELGKGTGLGLSTVYGIVKQSNGHIAVDSEPGRGTKFTLFLPEVDALPAPAPKPALPGAHIQATGTVLLAEDEPLLRELGETILQRAGYSVITAPDTAALATLIATYPARVDLLVTDVIMPSMSGPELAKLARKRWPDIRVLYMSGYADDDLQELQGDFAFLQKPFTPSELIEKIAEVLGGNR